MNMKFPFTQLILSVIGYLELNEPVKVNPLPAPRNITWGYDGPLKFSTSMKLQVNGDEQIIRDGFNRMLDTINELKWYPAAIEKPISNFEPYPTFTAKTKRSHSSKGLTTAEVHINDWKAELQLGVNETYSLNINSNSATIEIDAETIWGALHAFTTLQQLVIYDENEGGFIIEKSIKIWDAPIYKHRGLMIDSGRNFLTVSSIIEQIDIMSLTKLNSLHWHLEDSQSWPVKLDSYPEMTNDAYSNREVYTHYDIRYVVDYAKKRGVRVIPEIDLPGHARAGWRQVDENIVSCGNSWYSNDYFPNHTALEPPPGQLDILNNNTYKIVQKVYDEISSLFSDNVFHVGADELQDNCYNYSALIQNWLSSNSSLTMRDLTQYWIDHALSIFNDSNSRRLTMWEDILITSNGAYTLPKEVILQSWNNGLVNIQNLTSRGYDVIVSSSSHFYLDCGHGGFVTNDPRYIDAKENDDFNEGNAGSWCNPYKTWQRIYGYDFTAGLSESQKSHVIGAEVALWSEQADSTVLTQKIWPRTAALAESTWSGNRDPETGYLRTNWLTQRILNFREYLVALGHNASPLVPKFCLQNPHACDVVRNQTYLNKYGRL